MEFKFEYKAYEKGNKDVQKIERKIKWEKVDKDLYSAMVQTDIDQLKSQLINNEWALDDAISKTSQVMKNAAILSSSAKNNYKAKPKLKIWTPEIKSALRIMRAKYGIWKDNGKPMDINSIICKEKKESKKELRRCIRVKLVKQRDEEKELIMETKTKDMRLFHNLVRNNRKKGNEVVMDLNANGKQYDGEENVMTGFREHLKNLATFDLNMNIDNKYHDMVEDEIQIINDIMGHESIEETNDKEIAKAIRSINGGKSADYHGLAIEHIINVGKDMDKLLLLITNEIFRQGRVPEILKAGLFTPIFKNKGLKTQVTNNRGITVLPVISKIVEPIIKARIQNQVLEIQSRIQRGFTSGSSPVNSALAVEEC